MRKLRKEARSRGSSPGSGKMSNATSFSLSVSDANVNIEEEPLKNITLSTVQQVYAMPNIGTNNEPAEDPVENFPSANLRTVSDSVPMQTSIVNTLSSKMSIRFSPAEANIHGN